MKNILAKVVFFPLLVGFGMSCQKPDPVQIVFAFGPEDQGTISSLIERFNHAREGEIEVTWRVGSRLSNEFYEELASELPNESSNIDVFGADVVWTPAFASRGWVTDLSSKFYTVFNPNDFIEASMKSVVYQFRVWGIPWFTDAGMLYYRKDLLEEHGFSSPPQTWEELKDMCRKIMAETDIKSGFVFQGDAYEGGVANACEFIWNAGGSILMGDLSIAVSSEPQELPEILTFKSEEVRDGIVEAHGLIESGVSPEEVTTYRELESIQQFTSGDAIFMRGWPSAYGQIMDPSSTIKVEQVGVAPLPVSNPEIDSYSCLGGWNLMINENASDEEKDAAWAFILYLSDKESQKYRAIEAGTLPSFKSLYEDPELTSRVQVVDLARNIMGNTRVRPITPHYMDLSTLISSTFQTMLTDISDLENQLTTTTNRINIILETPL
jgi:multiple sugar transport system substrate-binding protein